jgi:hypothetical protein
MPILIEESTNIEALPSQVRSLSSSISDLAKLSMKGEFIDDNPIADMLEIMPKRPDCHVFDVAYWGDMMRRDSDENNTSFSILKSKAFQKPGVRLLIMPINQENINGGQHWSLGVIQPKKRRVYYYSSQYNDPYYGETFLPFIERFLKVQTPDKTYIYRRLEGPLQVAGCVDCALFTLNQISVLCSPPNEQITYTRKGMITSILERITTKMPGDLNLIIRDVHTRFVTLPTEWKHIAESRLLLADYRKAYLDLLARMLRGTKLYTDASIDRLIQSLNRVRLTPSLQEIENIFKSSLVDVTKVAKQESFVITKTKTKRKRQEILMYEGGEAEEKGKKTRRCLVYNEETQKKINTLVDQLLYLYRYQPPGKVGLSAELSDYVYEYLVLPLVSQALASFQMLDDVVDELFVRSNTALRDRLLEVVEKYVKPEECEKIVTQCLYCGSLSTSLSFCKK